MDFPIPPSSWWSTDTVCPIIDVGNPRAVLSSHSSLEQHHHHDLGGEHDDDHDDDHDDNHPHDLEDNDDNSRW